jgi:hypothetical protein
VVVCGAADCYELRYGWRVLGEQYWIVVVMRLLRVRRNWALRWGTGRGTWVLKHSSPVEMLDYIIFIEKPIGIRIGCRELAMVHHALENVALCTHGLGI